MAKPPSDLRYTKEHEWVRLDGDIATVGITDHAQEALGDVVFVELPEIGRDVAADEACARGGKRQGRVRRLCPARRQGRRDQPGDRRRPVAGEHAKPRARAGSSAVEIDDTDAFEALLDEAAYSEYVETLD